MFDANFLDDDQHFIGGRERSSRIQQKILEVRMHEFLFFEGSLIDRSIYFNNTNQPFLFKLGLQYSFVAGCANTNQSSFKDCNY